MGYGGKVEYARERKIRERNTRLYRLAHWPIWIWVFFLAPGPLTFTLFAHGFGRGNLLWLAAVLVGTGVAGLRGRLPGVEPRPYILRFDEDKPNPLYRRVCYTFAWNAVLSFALLNLSGLAVAAATGRWYMQPIYRFGYAPLCAVILLLGAMDGAAVLLRLGVGRDGGADAAAGGVEDPAGDTGRKPRQVGGVCGNAAADGDGGVSRDPAKDTADSAWGVDGRGLRCGNRPRPAG
jgi:hypothetical protein